MSILTQMAKAARSIAILGHIRPDGDCVSSCLAVYNYFLEHYPETRIQVYLEKPPARFSYLKNIDKISQDAGTGTIYDLCVCLDASSKERLGEFAVYLESSRHSICIDHHVTNLGYCERNEIRPDASSTCEFLFGFLEEEEISKAVAECIYTGILHDTNIFKNSNTSGMTMAIAGKMMDKGVNFGRIIDDSFYRKTYVQNQILGRALLESITFMDGKCIFTAVKSRDMEFYGVDGSDLEGIVEQLRITEGVECAIFMYELESHVYKVSMRSNEYVDVAKVASYFGGGGHVRAAGCSIGGSVYDVINNLSLHIERQIYAHENPEEHSEQPAGAALPK